MRRKSSPSKRSVEIQLDTHDAPPQLTSHSSSTTLTGLSPTHTPTLDRPLKSLLRVRLPPTAKNGTLMSIYTPSDSSPSSSLATNSAPRSAARKRVLFVLDEADSQLVRSPGQSSRGHSPSPVSTPTASPPGSNKHRLASHRIENERAPKERRLSGKSGVSPRASRENLRSEDGVSCPSTSSSPTDPTACTTPVKSPNSVDHQPLPEWMKHGRNYKGFCPFGRQPSTDPLIPTVSYSSLTSKEFFERFVAQRRPCILKLDSKEQTDFTSLTTQWTSNKYLKGKAGNCAIDVEVRDEGKTFGKGRKTSMSFGELLDAIEQGNETYYATTQTIKETDEGPVYLTGDLLWKTPLTNDFPYVPSIMKNLIPYQCNVWIGHSVEGSSSGLHHDYHDNLYVTIRGTKTFRLFSPRCAEALNTAGNIVKIHENGLICYNDLHRSDGADEALVFQWRSKQADAEVAVLRRRLVVTEKQIKNLHVLIKKASALLDSSKHQQNGTVGHHLLIKELASKKWIAIAKQFLLTPELNVENLQTELNSKTESKKLLEEYIETATAKCKQFIDMKENAEMKQMEMEMDEDSEVASLTCEEADWVMDDEDNDMETTGEPGESRPSLELLEEMADAQTKAELETKRRMLVEESRKHATEEKQDVDMEACTDNRQVDEKKKKRKLATRSKQKQSTSEEPPVDGTPDNFCHESTRSRDRLASSALDTTRTFPQSSKQCPKERLEEIRDQMLGQYLEVTLGPTDCLYLPSSWFHEVISTSLPVKKPKDKKASPGHMSFSFWFYPPAVPAATFTSPYVDEYWSSHYNRILQRMQFENRLLLMQSFDMNQGSGGWMKLLQLLQSGIPPEALDSLVFNGDGSDPDYEDDDDGWMSRTMMLDDEDKDEDSLALTPPPSPPKTKFKKRKKSKASSTPLSRKSNNSSSEVCNNVDVINKPQLSYSPESSDILLKKSVAVAPKLSSPSSSSVKISKRQKVRDRAPSIANRHPR